MSFFSRLFVFRRLLLVLSLCSFPIGFAAGFCVCYVCVKHSSPCTCAPCYPDKFCVKCGHVSKDCPKLRWYFNSSNYFHRVKK